MRAALGCLAPKCKWSYSCILGVKWVDLGGVLLWAWDFSGKVLKILKFYAAVLELG